MTPNTPPGLRQGYLSKEESDADEMASCHLTRRVKGKAKCSAPLGTASWSFALLQTLFSLFFNSIVSIHSFDAFRGKPLTEKVRQ